jgi:Transmembrane secretion effector
LGAYLFVLAAGLPFAFDAATFVLRAALVASIRRRRVADPTPDRPRLRLEMAEGIRWLFAHPGLRMLAIAVCVMNITLGGALAILVLYVRDRLGQGVAWYECATHVSLALTRQPWVAALTFVTFGVHGGLWTVVTMTLRQKVVPQQLLGRVNSVYYTFDMGGFAVGSLAGGLLARGFGLTAPFWVAAAAVAVVAMLAWHLFTPGHLTTEAGSGVNQTESGSLGLHQGEKPESR